MQKARLIIVFGAVLAAALIGTLLWNKQIAFHDLAVERDQLKAAVGEAEKRALDAETRLGRQNDEMERLRQGKEELLKLRGEVTQLRQAMTEAVARRQMAGSSPSVTVAPKGSGEETSESSAVERFGVGIYMPATEFSFAGFATPENVLETLDWALRNHQGDILEQVYLPAELPPAATVTTSTVTTVAEVMPERSGTTVLGRVEVGANDVRLIVRSHYADGSQEVSPMTFLRVGDEWRIYPLMSIRSPGEEQSSVAP